MKVNIGPYEEHRADRDISIEIENFDLWCLSSSVGLILLEWLKKFRDMDKHGIPCDMLSFTQTHEDYWEQGVFDFYKDTNPPFSDSEKEWNDIIDKMIWSFNELITNENADCIWAIKPEADWDDKEREPDGSWKMKWKVEGKMDYVAKENYENKIEEGLKLFAKHVHNLWD